MPYLDEWEWDDGNLKELARHGVQRRHVLEVAEYAPRFRRNKKGRAASHQMIGPDQSGAVWAICIVQLPGRSGTWRAVTGWRATQAEAEWYRRST